jgi:hypothetical protein
LVRPDTLIAAVVPRQVEPEGVVLSVGKVGQIEHPPGPLKLIVAVEEHPVAITVTVTL